MYIKYLAVLCSVIFSVMVQFCFYHFAPDPLFSPTSHIYVSVLVAIFSLVGFYFYFNCVFTRLFKRF